MGNAGDLSITSMNNFVTQRIAEIRQELPTTVRLIAVTKGVPVAMMRSAYEAGVRDFGESRVLEAIDKQAALADLPDICWHMIGHLQTNKARKTLQIFDWIHSVDSLKLLQNLERIAKELDVRPSICLQVKIWPDPQKYGWSVTELLADLQAIDLCQQLYIQGLMAIAPMGLTSDESKAFFLELTQLRDQISHHNWQHIDLPELSMGMSNDYQLAVASGATMIRVGSKIFVP
jgi:PLP dependent protein